MARDHPRLGASTAPDLEIPRDSPRLGAPRRAPPALVRALDSALLGVHGQQDRLAGRLWLGDVQAQTTRDYPRLPEITPLARHRSSTCCSRRRASCVCEQRLFTPAAVNRHMLLELGLLPDVAMARQDSGRLARFAAIFPETRRMASEIEEFADIEEALRCGYRYFGAGGFFGEKRRGLAEFSIAAKITTALCPAADGTLRVGHAGKLGDFSEGSWADSSRTLLGTFSGTFPRRRLLRGLVGGLFGREARRDGARQSSSPLRRSRVAWDFSAPLGSSRLLSAPLGPPRPILGAGASQVHRPRRGRPRRDVRSAPRLRARGRRAARRGHRRRRRGGRRGAWDAAGPSRRRGAGGAATRGGRRGGHGRVRAHSRRADDVRGACRRGGGGASSSASGGRRIAVMSGEGAEGEAVGAEKSSATAAALCLSF